MSETAWPAVGAALPLYRMPQRLTAFVYGLVCHSLFALAIVTMALALFSGMRLGRGPFRGLAAAAADTALLAMFPLAHSWLLSGKGRRWLTRLAPLGIGKELSTTVFAMIASVQLLALFLLWSPSGVVWWQARGWRAGALALAAAAAWLLLAKSMTDAQLSLQTGFLGWSAVFRNRSPRYRPFATQGVYRHVRQPIYLAFSLILWLTAVWTPDQIILAAILTGYCVIGAAMKERRYVRFFGEAYRAYQARVPFWLPFRRRASRESAATAPVAEHDCDTIVVGAGPVGLLLANQLGRRGLKVLVVERRCAPPDGSMAIGITPPSLAILKTLGLDREFARRGVAIDTARVHENRRHLGDVDFSRLPAEHRFILSLPQVETIAILRRNLALFPSVRVMDGVEFVGAESGRHGVRVTVRGVESGAACAYRAAWLAGCDGHRSAVRRAAGIRVRGRAYGCRFLMADFEDRSGLGREAHLYFGRGGSVESFPLPAGRRRWVVLAEKTPRAGEAIAEGVVRRVRERAGFDLAGATVRFESAFAPARQLAATYVRGRVVLCGDAAHVLSPIGGQGMNTGFADAAHLADALADAHANPAAAAGVLADYEAQRRRAFRVAAGRAARGMWLGTRTGSLFSGMRRFLIARLLLRPTIRERLAPYFAMLTIPGSDRWVAAAPATAGGPER